MPDRRTTDRRQDDRRAPSPLWRRPWALVAYGVLGTLVIIVLVNRSRPPQVVIGSDDTITTRTGPQATPLSPAERAPVAPQDARAAADLERLIAEGEAARGRFVQVELYCSSLSQISLRSVQTIEPAVAEVRDGANRVPAAECRWGARAEDEPRGDVLLIVPAEMASAFASAPIVDDGFVARRQVVAVVEWVGRSDALALRNAVILREYPERHTAMADRPQSVE